MTISTKSADYKTSTETLTGDKFVIIKFTNTLTARRFERIAPSILACTMRISPLVKATVLIYIERKITLDPHEESIGPWAD